VGQLCQRFGNRPIAVAVEQSRGALVFMLSKYESLHLFPGPSTMAANMREALYPSGAKDDPRDADFIGFVGAASRQAAPFVARHGSDPPGTKPGGGAAQAGG
jgi:hypothetical protein